MQFPITKAEKIRLLILDVDGVLTSGKLFYGPNQMRLLDFNVHDGLGIKLLQRSGVQIAVITARQSEAVTDRMRELNIQHVYQGQAEKISAYQSLKQTLKLSDDQIAYIGDDLTDLPLLQLVGLAATVANASQAVKDKVDWISSLNGGEGAVRQLCELLMQTQKTWDGIVATFLQA